MQFDQYAETIKQFCIYPDAGMKTDVEKAYLCLGLASEAGEIASLMKKEMRDGKDFANSKWLAEIGDVIWYTTRLLDVYGYTLEDAMLHNVDKLSGRKERNQLTGSGDDR